jgi:predicted ATP-dependent protease
MSVHPEPGASESGQSAPQLKSVAPPRELVASDLRGLPPLGPEELERASQSADSEELLGQQRAIGAIRLAIGIDAPGYNLYISGMRNLRERRSIMRLLEERAAALPTPGDWVYVNNFDAPESPSAIYLKPGQGRELRTAMRQLVDYVRDQLPKAFQHQDFDQERTALKEKYNRRAQELFGGVDAKARERGFVIQNTPSGQVIFIPLIDGKMPESPEALGKALAAKSEDERARIAKAQGELQDEMGSVLFKQQELMRELIEDIRAIERTFAGRLIAPAVDAISRRFENSRVASYLAAVSAHMLQHLDRFRRGPGSPENPEGPLAIGVSEELRIFEYEVNLLVDNAELKGAPVISETAPTYRNLFGTIERWVDPLGRSSTNFTRIISGSFLRAHGGFLIFDLEDAITEPGVWQTLKRSFKTGSMTPETFEPFPFFSLSGLKPQPIEVHNKVLVLGGPYLYNLLYFYDNDFASLFKVKAEVRPVIEAEATAVRHYAANVARLAKDENLPPFDGAALARLVEFGMRLAGDRRRVVTQMESIEDLAREAAYFARAEHASEVLAGHVEKALGERVLRLNFIEEEIRRLIADGTLIVDLDGRRVGQINGLAVLDVGGYMFGKPSRVTATVALGQSGVINIERESRLSGSTHDKGVMILSGFLRERFGQEHPVAVSASICFEQSYSGIDGDSASSTELYALLSALSGLPIRQDLAVTGSVDQYGNVQAIGGANEKIESFYRVCKVVGLTTTQGVMIPRANVKNLMLDQEVVVAVEAGRFHIYPIDSIDQGIELLTGVKAGTVDEPGTINYLVDQRLRRNASLMRGVGAESRIIAEPPPLPAPPKPPSPPEPQR